MIFELRLIADTTYFVIYFRLVDKEFTEVVAFGTHFLWHIFSGIGAFLLADYLYFIRNKELESQTQFSTLNS